MAAMGLGGILDVAALKCSVNESVFHKFISGLLHEMAPYPGKNSVIVMDNVKFHLSDDIQEMVEDW